MTRTLWKSGQLIKICINKTNKIKKHNKQNKINKTNERKREMKKKFARILAAGLAACMMTGCSVGQKTDTPAETSKGASQAETIGGQETEGEKKDTVVYGTPTAPVGTFLPILSYMGSDTALEKLIYASLLTFDSDGSLKPYLAESYTVSEDQKTIDFKIRQGVKWQDGENFTMDDLIFTLEQTAKSSSDSDKVSSLKGFEEFKNGQADSISGVTVLDGNVLRLELTEPYAPFLTDFGTYGIMPEHIWGEIPQEEWEKQLLNYPVGCGPYKVTKFEPGQYVSLEAHDDFFEGAPNIDNFILKVVNQDAISAELVSGNIDIVDVKELRSSEVEELEAQGFAKYSIPDNMYQYISFNLRRPVFQDKNLRQAILYAIDRALILDTIVEGRGKLLDSPFLPGSWASPAEGELNNYAYNPEKSKELLEASGWTDADGDGVRENADGEKLQFTIRCSNDSKTRENAVLYAKECLAEVGIHVGVSIEEDSVVADDCIYNHNFEMYALNCYFSDDPNPYGWWHSDSASDEPGVGSFNFGAYKNDLVDENIEKGMKTTNQEERKEYYLNVAKQINEDVPMIFLYAQDREIMCNPKLENFDPYTFNIFCDIWEWDFAQ